MSFPYPDKPWEDGQQAYYYNADGTVTIGTYNSAEDRWEMEVISINTDNEFIDTDHVLLANVPEIGARVAELREGDPTPPEFTVTTQSDMNNETLYSLFNQKRKQTRTRTRTDFIQNTIVDDEWEYDAAGQPNSLPEQGKFHVFDGNGNPNSHWEDTAHISINGTGRNTNSLSDIRRGSILQIQDVVLNTFAQFVCDKVEFIGNVEGGQFFVEIDVRAAYGRAKGFVPDGAVCEIQVISSHPCITTPDDDPPLVDEDGFLWFNEARRKLYVSRWDDVNNSPNGHALWIAVDRSTVVQTVTYYDTPDFFDDQDGAIAGSGTKWYISPQAELLQPGNFIEIGDQPAQVLEVEQKDDLDIAYTEVTLDREVFSTVENGELTHLHKPINAGDNLNPGGGTDVHVGEFPPDEREGALWFDTTRLELYVYYVEGEDGGWLPSSPLGARVSAGEALQQQILNRVNGHDNALDDLYANQADFLRNQISNDVTTSFRIKSGGNTLISTSGNKLGLYNLSEPTNPTHAINLGYADTNYLSLQNGGTIVNLTTVDRASGTAFKVKKSGVDHVKIEAGGKIFCNYNMELDDDDTTVPNKGWVKSRLPKFTDAEYGSNFLCKYGISTTLVNQGEVMFLGAQLNSITQPSSLRCIAFSEDGFNWDACLKSGVVKVNVGADNAGYYQVYNLKVNSGRNALLYVKPIEFDDSKVLEEDTGTPVYFQGVFFE